MVKYGFSALAVLAGYALLALITGGCAQMGYPTGGPKDSLPPVLIKATPEINTVNFSGNKITLQFNEYIDIQNIQDNLLVSPLAKKNPNVSGNLKTLVIKLRDTLKQNTTYTLQFGNAIKDVNEGNVLKNFSFAFSTGNHVDSLFLSGKVTLAQTGKTDSSLVVLLYKNINDSTVYKERPDYIAKLNGKGEFHFQNLPEGSFYLFALKDNDGGKTYNSASELFAFANQSVESGTTGAPVHLYAYALEKEKPSSSRSTTVPTSSRRNQAEKTLKFTPNFLSSNKQDLLKTLDLTFSSKLKRFDSTKILIADTNYHPLPYTATMDSTGSLISFKLSWTPNKDYILLTQEAAFEDSMGLKNIKNDTFRFKTLSKEDYGAVQLRFQNLDLSQNPVLQLVLGEEIKLSQAINGSTWQNNMVPPGDYEIRILKDRNQNGKWDAGNYTLKLQPEIAIALPQKLTVKANWDNERDIDMAN
ncbi:MAG: Ig-like domain-containing protein [Bacteroidetes bacterium]|nr:Ig-like domain-containing protein [Bacteroidota bacterium]MBS1926827.1 Ig-like domain-containing protein [Bacteroidota bacterium]MCC6692242.1 Ig-like domain-containing protein [Chitinophagaceae bacterium]